MDSPTTPLPEHEHRFLVTRDEAQRFLARAEGRLRLEVYDRARPVSWTRTMYLDTDDLSYLRSCSEPIARRLRVREYAAAADVDDTPALTGACFLELKESAGAVRTKLRFAAPPEVLRRIVDGASLDAFWGGQLVSIPPLRQVHGGLRRGDLAPRLTTWYRRVSLVGQRVRVTLDENIIFCRPTPVGLTGQPIRPEDVVGHGPPRILEVKLTGAPPDWLIDATAGLAEAHAFSKFRAGMDALARASRPASTYATQPLRVINLQVAS